MTENALTERHRQILACIESAMRDRGYPPSVREIGEAVGLSSSSTVHAHLATLQKLAASGVIRPDERVVVYITGHGLKTLDAVAEVVGPTATIRPTIEAFHDAFPALQESTR